jgi:uncharacterized protein YcfJ
MNKKMMAVATALIAALLTLATGASAAEVTLKGTVVCAKCTLKKADAQECQNVLLVPGRDGKDVEYYIAPSKAAEALGEVCTERKKATLTGTVSEKDGRKWITASKVKA